MKPTVYIVFDQLPKKEDGGLIATYINFVNQFKNEFDIKLVSVFSNGGNDIESFGDIAIIDLSSYILDNRFFRGFAYLKKREFHQFFHAIASAIRFFTCIPFTRSKTKKLFKDCIVIATSPAAAMFLSNKIKFILEIHTSYDYFWGNNLLGRLQSSLAAKPAITLFRNKSDAQKACGSFCSSYIYNGVEVPQNHFLNEPTKRHLHSALFVGRLTEHKNPLFLLRCAKEVRTAVPDFHLDIYGSGELEDELRREIINLDLVDTVSLQGFIDDKTIYSRYEQFWLSSKLEGFGLVLIEAMANCTPVITTNWGDAVFEIVRNGETGFIVNNESEFSQTAISLFRDKKKQKDIAKNAYRDFRSRFSMECNKTRWDKIFSLIYPELK